MKKSAIDSLDRRILEALQKDGRLTQEKLAELTGSTPSTCLRRVQALRDSGHLTSCVYLADPKKLGRGLKAIITVVTTGHGGENHHGLTKRFGNEPAVNEAYGVTGEVDIVISCSFIDMEEYQQMCERLFYGNQSIVRYSTLFIVETYKMETAIAVAV